MIEARIKFTFCGRCERYAYTTLEQSGRTCNECGRQICQMCGVELIQPEQELCSICVSSSEHICDLGWWEECDASRF